MKTLNCILAFAAAVLPVDRAFGQTDAPPPAAPAAKTPDKQPVKIYDEQADAKTQIADALAKAKKDNRRVLIQWGGNWCPWCVKLHGLFKNDKDIAKKLQYEYEVVFVDAGRPKNKNMDLAKSYDASINGFPYLTILDSNGEAVANQETGSLESKDQTAQPGHDPKAVLDFLTRYQPKHLDAQWILDNGLAQARKSNKRVFLHFGAPWCGWCRKMEQWMARDDVNAILSKDFVDVKIDVDRTNGGKDVLKKYNADEAAGIPWFALLDAEGKSLADSTATDPESGKPANIGFPAKAEELAHFKSMLTKAAKKITPAEIDALIATLEAIELERQKAAANH